MHSANCSNLVEKPDFLAQNGQAAGWSFASPRPELEPLHSVEKVGDGTRLAIKGNGVPHVFGCWQGNVNLQEGKWYYASVKALIKGIANPELSVFAQVGMHFLIPSGSWDGEILFEQKFKFHNPQDGSKMDLYLRFDKEGYVQWYEPFVEEITEPEKRMARLATVRFSRLTEEITVEQQRERIKKKLDEAGALKPDIVALTEMCTICDVRQEEYTPFEKIGESVPNGPTCRILSERAKRYSMHVLAGLIERRGKYLFNTAVLFGRDGSFLGQYDKTHLTFTEMLWGLSCGTEYPVFDLDFGRIGIHICYDEWYPEVSRYYAHKGAEILFLPVAGGKPITWRTRALDNRVYFVSASMTPPSMIIDSSGVILAETFGDGVAYADVDLNYRKTNWYEDPTWTNSMPYIVPQMRNCADNFLLDDLHRLMITQTK